MSLSLDVGDAEVWPSLRIPIFPKEIPTINYAAVAAEGFKLDVSAIVRSHRVRRQYR